MLELNKENFEKEVIDSKIPVLVDFYASWCGPCQMMAPVLEKVSGQYGGKLKFAKLNTEANAELAQKYEVRSIPCLIMFSHGKELDRMVGFKPEQLLKTEIDNILS